VEGGAASAKCWKRRLGGATTTGPVDAVDCGDAGTGRAVTPAGGGGNPPAIAARATAAAAVEAAVAPDAWCRIAAKCGLEARPRRVRTAVPEGGDAGGEGFPVVDIAAAEAPALALAVAAVEVGGTA